MMHDVLITTPFFDRVLAHRRVLMDEQDPRLFIWPPTTRASCSNSVQVFDHHSSLVRRVLHKTPAPILPLLGRWLGCVPSLGLSRHFAQRDGGVQQSDLERVVGNVVSSIDGALWSLRRALHWKLRFEKRGRVA